MHFRAILLCKRLHRQLALELPPPLYLIIYNRGGTKMITLCLGFINIRKQNESKATHKTTQRHKTKI